VILTFGVMVSAWTADAQRAPQNGAQRASRAELSARVTQLEQQTSDGTLKGEARNAGLGELAAIKNRLQVGDFRVGDRFVITVRQDSVRSDTASVRDSLRVSVLNLPDVALSGVLRSELDERMSAHVARFLRNVTVRTNVLTRVAVFGAVAVPGYYHASPDRPVTDLVMLAGGPIVNANLNQLTIRRGQATVLSAKDSKRLLKDGRTLEQMDVQSGDEINIPLKKKINWQFVIQIFFIISSLLFALISFLQWYYDRQNN
jgi:hypothetical protein